MSQLFVNEVFGPTFQGEGPSTGKRAHFLRLGLCNLKCTWCDTAYTWDWKGESEMARANTDFQMGWSKEQEAVPHAPNLLLAKLRALGTAPLLVVSGGEPLLQRLALHEFLNYASHSTEYTHVEIETNGTVSPGTLKFISSVAFNVSPKLVGSGNDDRRRNMDVLDEFAHTHKARFKFVLTGEEDLDEAVFLVSTLGIDPSRVWAMPEGTDLEAVVQGGRDMAQSILNIGWNLSTRMHVLLWGNERGK